MQRIFVPHVLLKTLGVVCNGSSAIVVIVRGFIHQIVYPVFEHFVEAVVEEADYWKLFFAIASGLLIAVN